jgi:hypothetical protein
MHGYPVVSATGENRMYAKEEAPVTWVSLMWAIR